MLFNAQTPFKKNKTLILRYLKLVLNYKICVFLTSRDTYPRNLN